MKKLLAILAVLLLTSTFVFAENCPQCPPPCPGCGEKVVSDEAYLSANFYCLPEMDVVGADALCFGNFFTGSTEQDISKVCDDPTKKMQWKVWGPMAGTYEWKGKVEKMNGTIADLACVWWDHDGKTRRDWSNDACHWDRGSTSCRDAKTDVKTMTIWCMPVKVTPNGALGLQTWKCTACCKVTL